MKIENKCCKSMTKLSELEYGTVIRHAGNLFLITDDGANEGCDFNEESDRQMVVDLEDGCLITLPNNDKYEVVKAKVVLE